MANTLFDLPGLSGILGLGAKSTYTNTMIMVLRNASGANLGKGAAVRFVQNGAGTELEFTTSTVVGQQGIMGVLLDSIATGSFGRVAMAGFAEAKVVSGTTQGLFLQQSATAGVLQGVIDQYNSAGIFS